MTKKHFIELAETVKALNVMANPSKENVTSYLADFCAKQNPNFNRERWLAYIKGECGKNGGKV